MIIDGLEVLPTTPTSGDELPIEREDKAYKIDYDALAAAILRLCVTGVKGNAESSYRLGNVNITPANIGAKETQAAVGDPSASGTSITFIASIVQNAQGVITPTKKTVASATQSSDGLMSANDKAKLDGIAAGAQPNVITGVKGNAESSYRQGNVNLTPANIGAMPDSTPIPSKTSDLTNDSGFITQHQDISGKADKVSDGTSGNFAALDANGNIADSGHKHSDYLTAHQDISGKKNTQSPVSDPSASGNSLEFIAGIAQNAQGVITPNKKTVSTMVGATNSSEGRAGLVPVPPSNGYNSKFLRADGTWETPASISVSGVKGDAEADYRHGNINLTPANLGAQIDIGLYVDEQGYLCQAISSD